MPQTKLTAIQMAKRTRKLGGRDAAQQSTASKEGASRSRTVRGRKGGLKDMPAMPLDILLEVKACLLPLVPC